MASGPVKEVVRRGKDVDLGTLPQIVHHQGDAGPYVTAAISFAKDPASETWNCAYNRLMLQGRDTTSIHLTLGKHLWEFSKIAEARGEPLPVAFAIGVHPAIALGALAIGSIDEDERAIMGALLGEPLELVKCETSDVLVPAHAELVLEGEILPAARVAEGPFGEFTGYSLGERQREIVRYTAITHRRDAMFQDITVAHLDHMLLSTIPMEANLYRAVRAMVPSIKAVRVPGPFTCYVSIEQRLPGQAKNAIMAVLGADLYMKRVVVVDPTWTCSTIVRSTGRSPPAASPIATSPSSPTRAAPTSTPHPARTATPPSGAWTPPPSRAWPPTRRATGCPPRCGSACVSRTFCPDPAVSENFAGLIAAVARRHPERIALRWDGGSLTYGELVGRVDDTARRLLAGGLRPGERLAVAIPNCPEFVTVVLGGIAAGAIVAPLDVLLKAEERAAILADLRPARLVESDPAAASGHDGESGRGGAGSSTRWPARRPPLIRGRRWFSTPQGAPGVPRARCSLPGPAIANQSWAGPVIGLRDGDVLLAALPLSHAFGINGALFAPLLAGTTVALVERFVPDAVAGLLERLGVTVMPGVATMFRRLLDLPGFSGASGLRLGVSGAAPCPWDLAQEWRAGPGCASSAATG